jgi:hypothetical protein
MQQVQRWVSVIVTGLLLLKAWDRFVMAANRAATG